MEGINLNYRQLSAIVPVLVGLYLGLIGRRKEMRSWVLGKMRQDIMKQLRVLSLFVSFCGNVVACISFSLSFSVLG